MKIRNFILTASFAVLAFAANAQDNVVKLGLPGLALGQANLYYERMLTPRMSVNVQLGYNWGSDISNQLQTQADNRGASTSNNSSSINLTTGKFNGGFQIAPELRFYTGDKEGPRGFYVGPRLNFSSYTATLKGTHTYGTAPVRTSDDKVVINYSNFGLGVQMGYQWLINDQISIDWGFLGAGAGLGTITGTGTTNDTAELQKWADDANGFATENGLKFLGVSKDGTSLTVQGSSVLPTFRSSLTIGYAF